MLHTLKFSTRNKLLCLTALAVCFYFTASFLFLVLSNFWPGPLFDYWIDIPLIEKAFNHQLTFNDLISAHNNAHRILIPRLLFILDYRFFAGTNILLVITSLLCKFCMILLFNFLLKDQKLPTKLLLNALIFAALLNAGNVYNVIFNFDIQWDLVTVFACYSIFFYIRFFQNKNHLRCRILAYLFLCLGFLSHAGALSLPFVFIIIAAFNKKAGEVILNIVLTVAIFYTNSLLPFADPQNPDIQSAFATLILHADAVAIFITKFLSGSLAFYLGTPGLYFSFYILLLFFTCMVLSLKAQKGYSKTNNNLFLYISLFLFLMITTIAAARTMFSPNVWAASRFQTTVLAFILCLHIHAWLMTTAFLKDRLMIIFQSLLALHGFVMLFAIQYFTYNIPYKLSNVVFFSHAYMLSHERNHHNAPRLLLWIHDKDVIADSDSFFRKNGFAWYANKQGGNGNYRDFTDAGGRLISTNDMTNFQNNCSERISSLEYQWTAEGGIEFSAPLNDNSFISAAFNRSTYYALDKEGIVIGSGYIFVNDDGFYKHASLKGYSISKTIRFFSEIGSNHKPACLYSVIEKN